jgi:hypothetical protein
MQILVVLVLFLAAACRTSTAVPAVLPGFAVQIDVRGNGGGSGVYLGDGRVLTCRHLFDGSPGRTTVQFPDGRGCAAALLAADDVWDLALLRLTSPPAGVPAAAWAESLPRVGDPITLVGYGSSGAARIERGRLAGYAFAKERSGGPKDTLIIRGTARPGDSGGPLLSDDGKLVGIVWGAGQGDMVGTQLGRCQKFLREAAAALRDGGSLADAVVQDRLFPNFCRPAPRCGPFGCPVPAAPPQREAPPQRTLPNVSPPEVSPPVVAGAGEPQPDPCADLRRELAACRARLAAADARIVALEQQRAAAERSGDRGLSAAQLEQLAARIRPQLQQAVRVRVERLP